MEIFVNRNKKDVTIHLWDDEIGYKKITHKTYANKKSPTGMYRSLYGDKLKKVNYYEYFADLRARSQGTF